MSLYLRSLSIFYFFGFLLHLADLFGFRLNFSEMDAIWKSWIIFLLVGDLFTSIFLWKLSIFGIWSFLFIAIIQTLIYTIFPETFGSQYLIIFFHVITVTAYFAIGALKIKIDIAGSNTNHGHPRAVGNFLKMYKAYIARGISFKEAAMTIHSTVAFVNEDTRFDYGEQRFNLVGLSPQNRVLHVTFAKRNSGAITRLISVRKAKKNERRQLSERFPCARIN